MSEAVEPALDRTAHAEPGWFLRLERASDRLSPILVKEVRQFVRGRDFSYSFAISLVVGLGVAFFGAADAAGGSTTAGGWTFTALTTCLALLGFAIVPLGAFNTLRNERLEQTFDLIALTALTPRKIIVGKLLAQAVKLGTLFAGMAPFVATSFLLGGVDFVSICISLALVFTLSVWVCALCILMSAVPRTRAASGVVFAGLGIGLLLMFMVGRALLSSVLFTPFGAAGISVGLRAGTATLWWALAGVASACAVSLVNLVLLAENRLAAPTDDRSTALRAGFLLQFALALGWALSFINGSVPTRSGVLGMLGTYAAIHLGIVGAFTITEDMAPSRRVQMRLAATPRWRRWLVILRPGPQWGVVYIAVQMALLFPAVWALGAAGSRFRWLMALCGYVAVFTGLPTALVRAWRPATPSWVLRVVILFVFAASLILPDVLYFVIWRPRAFTLEYSARHLLNAPRTLANWTTITMWGWDAIALLVAGLGLLSYMAVWTMRTRREKAGLAPQQFLSTIQVPDGRENDG
jgi:hypothetical protein